MAGRGDEPLQKRRRIHLDVMESVALSQSREGSASLRQPIERKHPATGSNQGLEPRYRGRTRSRFCPPRRVSSQPQEEEVSASSSQKVQGADGSCVLNSNKETCSNSPLVLKSQNDSNPFGWESDELEKEMVEQSSDQSIHLLSTLGGFTSAAGMQQNSATCSFSSVTSSPAKNNWTRTGSNSRRQKQMVKDANQSSITSFMSSSLTSASCSTSASGSCNVKNQWSNLSSERKNPFGALSSHPAEKIQDGSPSKMYSPIKKVSENVYTISDEDSPSCSPGIAPGNNSARAAQAKSVPVAKTPFSPPSTQTSSAVRRSSTSLKRASGRGKRCNSSSRKATSAGGTYRGKKAKSQTDCRQRTMSSMMLLTGVDFDEADDNDFLAVSAPVAPVRLEVEVGRTYGLLNDSKVTVTRENCFEKLPADVVENIFCSLPMLDLCLSVNRVCLTWNDIISNPKFIPWKKTYHRLKMGEADAKREVHTIINENGMQQPSLRLLNLIRYMQKVKRVTPDNNASQLLEQHPKYTWALALLTNKVPECIKDKDPNPWSLMCALVMVAATVHDIHLMLQLLMSPRSHLMCLEVLECFYCIATFLLAFRLQHLQGPVSAPPGVRSLDLMVNVGGGKKSSVVSGLHYRLFYALYLYENSCISNHSMLQETMANRTGQQSIIRYSRGDTEVRLTHEQMRIVKYTPDKASREVIKIFAFAGSGKTTTLVRYTQMRPDLKFLLIVFNKSVCTHAQATFPRNVTCKTGHSLAFGATGSRYAAKKQLNIGNLRVYDVAMVLEERVTNKENHFVRAKFVMETLKNYMSSDDEEITSFHTPASQIGDDGRPEPIPHDARMRYAYDATQYWNRMRDLRDERVKMTHDGYLKLFQLSKPTLGSYDVILVDEAQDLTPALLDVILQQRQPRIFVGDEHQQIYAFRGAVNAMQAVKADRIFYLTQSFRFGPEISQLASTILELFKGEHSKNIVGHATPDTTSGEEKGQLAVLCRSNYTVFAEAVAVCVYSDKPVRVAFVGGLEGFGFSMLMDIYTLMLPSDDRRKENHEIKNRFIARFRDLAELEKYATKTMDVELLGKIRIVRTYQLNLPMCLSKISQKTVSNTTQADVLFSTVHKAKGLEFSTVKITDDFVDLYNTLRNRFILQHPMNTEEANLLYVAVTRAKRALIMSKTIRMVLSTMGGGCYRPVLTDQLRQEGVELKCVATQKEFKPQALTLYRHQVTLSNKHTIAAGVVSPEAISGADSEYAHLFGNGFDKSGVEDEKVVVLFDDDHVPIQWE